MNVTKKSFEKIEKLMETAKLWTAGVVTRIDIQYNYGTGLYSAVVWSEEDNDLEYKVRIEWTDDGMKVTVLK